MEDLQVTALVLNSLDYKEKDKIVRLFTVELGNISAILKGVSGANSKFKFATQSFCFAQFELVKSHEFYVVKNVFLIDSFFDITSDYDEFMLSTTMLEICNHILRPNIISENLFLGLIKTLKNIVYNKIYYRIAILKFYIELLKTIGYSLNFDSCDNCNMKFLGDIKFDMMSGTFRCANCSGGVVISKQLFATLKNVSNTDIDRLHTLKVSETVSKECLDLVMSNIGHRLNFKFKAV